MFQVSFQRGDLEHLKQRKSPFQGLRDRFSASSLFQVPGLKGDLEQKRCIYLSRATRSVFGDVAVSSYGERQGLSHGRGSLRKPMDARNLVNGSGHRA